MAVMAREVWTDERLDDLNRKVDAGFKETREEFKAVRSEIGEVRSELNALSRVILQLTFGIVGTMLVGFLGIMATLIAKL